MNMRYNEEKATALACRFLELAGGELEDLKLMKLMYLAEREAIRLRNVGITGDRMVSMKNGPVLKHTLDRLTPLDQIDPGGVWREYIEIPSKWEVRLKRPFPPEKALSRGELTIADEIWKGHGNKSKWQLVELTHTFDEWRDPGESRRPIQFQEILIGLGFDDVTVKSRTAEHNAADAMDLLLNDGA